MGKSQDVKTSHTLEYYNEKAAGFTKDTVDVEFTSFQQEFLDYLPKGASILDLGCGSGRDSKAFLSKGYRVTAVDGSEELCKIASAYIGQPVICSTFQEYNPNQKFDGVWACASLLHLDHEDLQAVMDIMIGKLNPGGCFYLSFKYGKFSGMRNGRFFTDMTEKTFKEFLGDNPVVRIEKMKTTVDVRVGRENEKWLNVFLICIE